MMFCIMSSNAVTWWSLPSEYSMMIVTVASVRTLLVFVAFIALLSLLCRLDLVSSFDLQTQQPE